MSRQSLFCGFEVLHSLVCYYTAGLFVTCIPMGKAITAKVLHADSEAAKVFLDWIRKVFVS